MNMRSNISGANYGLPRCKSLAMNAKCKRMMGRDTSGAAKSLDATSMNRKLANTGGTTFGCCKAFMTATSVSVTRASSASDCMDHVS